MKFAALSTLALATAAVAQFEASSMMKNKMEFLMRIKTAHREKQKSSGVFEQDKYKVTPATACNEGRAGEYSCENVDLTGHLTHEALGSTTREGNDIWGWTSEKGREFAIVGQTDGTSFVEISKNGSLTFIGRLPTQTTSEIWRDMKVIGHHVYIVSEADGHGLQIFDLNKLPRIHKKPRIFDPKKDLTAWYSGIGSSHNVIANPESNRIVIVGAEPDAACKGSNGGPIILDVTKPSKPQLLGCFGQDGYCHDAIAITYRGIDTRFYGDELIFCFSESKMTIINATNAREPVLVSRAYYDGSNGTGAYTHQGWFVDEDRKYLLLDDERDEMRRVKTGEPGNTRTYVFDMSDLINPKWTGLYKSPVPAVDHNQYVVDGIAYQANYASGLRVVDVRNLADDPTGGNMKELAHFDCWPEDDEDPKVEFFGAWSSYAWFKSGIVVLNCIERGMFALKVNIGY
ncbi:Uncharacterized protein TPAR_03922 [Tolypocladium paradoxum]|uniref:Regulatory P domain-containing protein n=1 Tax=Tolypocladium paradoxum TaxID=94208 RepID=A0A2S4L0B6_9HYPO|nr:Uncharacterized protein TPAR_03922 [Tolypocladium paradoxum]